MTDKATKTAASKTAASKTATAKAKPAAAPKPKSLTQAQARSLEAQVAKLKAENAALEQKLTEEGQAKDHWFEANQANAQRVEELLEAVATRDIVIAGNAETAEKLLDEKKFLTKELAQTQNNFFELREELRKAREEHSTELRKERERAERKDKAYLELEKRNEELFKQFTKNKNAGFWTRLFG